MNVNFNNISDAFVSNNVALSKIYGQNGLLLWEKLNNPYLSMPLTIEIAEYIPTTEHLCVWGGVHRSDMKYSINNGPWKDFIWDTANQQNVLEKRAWNIGDTISLYNNDYHNIVNGDVPHGSDGRIEGMTICLQVFDYNNNQNTSYKFKVYGNPLSLYTDNYANITNLKEQFYVKNDLYDGGYYKVPENELPLGIMKVKYSTSSNYNKCIDAENLYLSFNGLFPHCYEQMFERCNYLTVPPLLPATTLASWCYNKMFRYCERLTNPPLLPATTLASNCYYSMFDHCTSLTTAPLLPATTLAAGCYQLMFNECSSLSYIKCLATDISVGSPVTLWVYKVSTSGTFVKASSMNSWTTGTSGIPSGWTVQNA